MLSFWLAKRLNALRHLITHSGFGWRFESTVAKSEVYNKPQSKKIVSVRFGNHPLNFFPISSHSLFTSLDLLSARRVIGSPLRREVTLVARDDSMQLGEVRTAKAGDFEHFRRLADSVEGWNLQYDKQGTKVYSKVKEGSTVRLIKVRERYVRFNSKS